MGLGLKKYGRYVGSSLYVIFRYFKPARPLDIMSGQIFQMSTVTAGNRLKHYVYVIRKAEIE